jgi:hypothetical protein
MNSKYFHWYIYKWIVCTMHYVLRNLIIVLCVLWIVKFIMTPNLLVKNQNL